jgi:hypothetical protein
LWIVILSSRVTLAHGRSGGSGRDEQLLPQELRREVSPVRPDEGVQLGMELDARKISHVLQRLKHLAYKIPGEVDRALKAIVEARILAQLSRNRGQIRVSAETPLSGPLSSMLASRQPPTQGRLGLVGGQATKQRLDTDVFIDGRPMDAGAIPDELPVLPLFARRMLQAWIPGQRNRNGSAITELHRQLVIGAANGHGARPFNLLCRRTHPRPPIAADDLRR